MHLDAILCNHAESVNNLLYVSGGGVGLGQVGPGANPPYGVTLGIGLMVTVDWSETNVQHLIEIDLLSEDGDPVHVPTGPGATSPFKVQLGFNVGRPPTVVAGDDQFVCLAANMPGLPLPAFGKYEFVVRLDGRDVRRLPYRIVRAVTTPPGPLPNA